ncbi:MAG: hypothetical protein QXJ59_11100 [Thermofilaceae archaeon]
MLGDEAGHDLNAAVCIYFEPLLVRCTNLLRKYGVLEVKASQWRGLQSWRYRIEEALGGYELILWGQRRTALTRALTRSEPGKPPKVEFDEAVFLVKYYPHPDEPYFEDFSVEEQALRLSEVFNNGESIFPVEKHQDKLEGYHFTVGTLMLAVGVRHGFLRLSITSQERFVSIAEEGVKVLDRLVVEPNGIDRNVPGWDLSWKLFSAIAKVFKYYLGKPYMIVEFLEPGKLWRCKGEGCREEEAPEQVVRILEFIYVPVKEAYLVELIEESVERTAQSIRAHIKQYSGRTLPCIRVLWKEGLMSKTDSALPLIDDSLL